MNQPAGQWSEQRVAGQTCHVYEPPERNSHGYVVLYLHGVHLGTLHDKPAFLEQFDQYGLPVVCPMTGRCWWLDRPCPDFAAGHTAHDHVVQHVLPWIEERFGARPPQIALLGTSMGGQGALLFSYRHPDLFPVCAAIAPAIDFYRRVDEGDEILMEMFDDAERARQESPILHIHPLNWPRHQFFCCDPLDYRWYDGADRLRMKLQSLGVPHQCDLTTRAGGHGFEYYSTMAPRACEFLVEALESERRRA